MSELHLNDLSKIYLEQIAEKKDDSYLETDMKKRQANNEKARKDMEKIPGQKNPHFEAADMSGAPSIKDAKPAKKTNVKYDPHMKVMAPQKEEVELMKQSMKQEERSVFVKAPPHLEETLVTIIPCLLQAEFKERKKSSS